MGKFCELCGMMKKTTFNCGNCGRRVCLDCFYFTSNICADCMTIFYAEKYKEKIDSYANA
jgi:hypothetical protein